MLRRAVALGLACLLPGPALLVEEQAPLVYQEEGKASYYSDKFQGKKTASGEKFDQGKPAAAHPELPLGSKATVENPETGKSVEVEIVDRGPHAKDRDIDLSKAAARKIGLERKEGVEEVEIKATTEQVKAAIETPEDAKKVEEALKDARQRAEKGGTEQPGTMPKLAPEGEQAKSE
jgi:rare lipoprotein A